MMRNKLYSFFNLLNNKGLPRSAREEEYNDRYGLYEKDPGITLTVEKSVEWLNCAQDNSIYHDGGVAGYYSFREGWSSSYPETTGYIIPTIISYAKLYDDELMLKRAKRMADWLISIQFSNGAFQGGLIDAKPNIAVAFNTGQILIGLAACVREFGEKYLDPMYQAANWLVEIQDSDGYWRKYPSPFAKISENAYQMHIAWGLLEAARIMNNANFVESGLANIKKILTFQHQNGWFDNCCISDPSKPLTHTIGYALRGMLEAYRYTKEKTYLSACQKTADGLLTAIHEDGFLAGRLNDNWEDVVSWSCLTGTVQIAYCWLALYQETKDSRYRTAAYTANQYVRRRIKTEGQIETKGGVKGSFPIDGEYCPYQFISWGCKFFIDSNLFEQSIREN